MNRLQNKVAVITGGARGIGKATARKFVAEGANVAIWDINEDQGKATVTELEKEGIGQVRFYKVNTTDIDAVMTTANQVVEDFGGIDILVNNAGITRDASMKKMTADQWQQVIDVNLTGVFNCTKASYPFMVERGGGRIISAASVVAHNGNFGQTNYVATKAGVIGMTKTWAREFGRRGITANAIAPGFINTEMIQTVPETILDNLKGKTPLGRLGEAEDIANAYCFLASDEAAFITGTVMNVDGGLVM
ncbi:MAG: 3-oxoacyl-ACP reductase FabG [Bacteroidota bacterium]